MYKTVEEAIDGMLLRMNAEVTFTQKVARETRLDLAREFENQLAEVVASTPLEKCLLSLCKQHIAKLRK